MENPGARIKQARLAAGLSLRLLGERAGISQTAVNKYERGELVPASAMLLKLAHALNVLVEYFFRSDRLELEHVEYRHHSKLSGAARNRMLALIRERSERQFALDRLLPDSLPLFELPGSLPERIATLDAVEDAALALRHAWKLGENPIPDMVGTLEDHGVIVLLMPSLDQRFNGLSARVDGKPVIAVGEDWPGDRQRFTLAHELGHRVLAGRLASELDQEKACNRFAGAFLVPAGAVYQTLGRRRHRLEPRELWLLKQEYGLSMAGWIMRAQQTGCITKSQAAQLHGLFRKRGWHLAEPGEPYPQEYPQRFEQQVYRALAEDLINEAKAAQLLGKPLFELYGERTDRLDAATG